jgi:hypothetical protein
MTQERAAEVCGRASCGHTLDVHSEDGICWACTDAYAAHYFQTQPSPAECSCCGEPRTTVAERDPGHGARVRLLCDECWADPAIAYADCKHGYAEASPLDIKTTGDLK